MDNPLTPNKIQRLLHLAEDKSFNNPRSRRLISDVQAQRAAILLAQEQVGVHSVNNETSSGILDLEHIEGFGESGVGTDVSISSFNPSEMTGRSTDAQKGAPSTMNSHNQSIDNLTSQLDKQTEEINNLMRNSIAANYTFHSKRDLTADEISYVMREAPLPTMAAPVSINDCSVNSVNSTVTSYLRRKCPDLASVLGKMDSPDRSMFPSISEVSYQGIQEAVDGAQFSHQMDKSLDSVPVKQPKTNSEISQTVRPTYLFSKNLDALKVQSENIDPKVPKKQPEGDVFKMPMAVNTKTPSKPLQAVRSSSMFVKNLQNSLAMMDGNTESSELESLSVSRIAEVVGRQSNISLSDIINMQLQQKYNRKQPLTEVDINTQIKKNPLKDHVVPLIDSKKTDTASSAGTINTIISNKPERKFPEIPEIAVCQASYVGDKVSEISKTQKTVRSKSPSSKSQSTLSTVQEQMASFKIDSPLHNSKGEQNASHIPSPNVQYKELDKSIDWCEILQPKLLQQEGSKEMEWAEIVSTPVNGFVGASIPANINITTLTDNWLTANIKFHKVPRDLNIELPRQPFLLSPRKSEQLTLYVTSNAEIIQTLPFTLQIKDASIDEELEQKGLLEIDFKMPIIQALSIDGMNKLDFPTVQETLSVTKAFVLISDCPVDLLYYVSVVEGDTMFFIKSVQEIKKSEVNKILKERDVMEERGSKIGTSRQLCRLTSGNAIKVTVTFQAPKLADLNIANQLATMNGALNVNLLDVQSVLKKIDLAGVVGSACLKFDLAAEMLQVSSEGTTVRMTNSGTVNGTWALKRTRKNELFRVSPQTFDIAPGAQKAVLVSYVGANDEVCEGVLYFVNVVTGKESILQLKAGKEKPKPFPIKANHLVMSWLRAGRKEISLKNFSETKIQVRCEIVGEGFLIDYPGLDNRGVFSLVFGPLECKKLNVVFSPINPNLPHTANLNVSYGKNSDYSKKISFYGCDSPNRVRWLGLVTYDSDAFLSAECRAPIVLRLQNKAHSAAFVAARVQFSLKYTSIEPTCRISGARNIIPARNNHTITLQVDWSKVEKRASQTPSEATLLATVTVLTGAEITRRRILRVLRETSRGAGTTNMSILPDRLQVITDRFDGEDPNTDKLIADFHESNESLEELYAGLFELTAKIDLPRDISDSTMLITDDTVMDHKTICD